MNTTKNSPYSATAYIGEECLTDQDIQNIELVRARRSLAFLKNKIGNDAMVTLIEEELNAATIQTEKWANESNGEWKSGFVVMEMPGVSAEQFHSWFIGMMERNEGSALGVAHPDHYLNRMLPDGRGEVIENLGEFEYPWHMFLNFTDIDSTIPVLADKDYPIGFAAIVKSTNGKIIAYALHELRDHKDGMQAKLAIILPKAAPDTLIRGHLNHFSIEFRNWYNAMSAK
ncbi:hypothetical protein psyc5s11_33280 [Clostridium gelidum]|uniref:Uncharacterized protein n=1 Tax=Clostridium gelidum TaxID=704125 RepID=A0ABM7T7K5_9CLOT|nr:hypothetical protein [Clostridium gelidum]BCZ47261.1 hypothetical protein psyc5s11_33280 [Clostridium gelidum]